MNNVVRQQLCEIVRRHGRAIIDEPRRLEGLLRDYCAGQRREIAVLVNAVEERVAADLLQSNVGTPRAVLFARLAGRLHDSLAMSEDAARWAVASWALALKVITDEQLQEWEEKTKPAEQTQANFTPVATTATTVQTKVTKQPATSVVAHAVVVVSRAGDGDYTSISEAIRNAVSGTRILVKPGLYEESVVVDKFVEIGGDGLREEIVVTSNRDSCVRMQAAQAVVRGLTLRAQAGAAGKKFFAVDIPQGKLILEDCDIVSDSLSCVGILNATADPLIRRCAIHDSSDSGIYIFEGAAGKIEDCDIYGNANVGVAISGGARPLIKGCKIHDGRDAGIVVWDGGAGLIEDCDIYDNRSAGIGISEGGEPTVRRCQIYRGGNTGVFVHRNGRALLEDCNIFGNAEANVAVTLGGNLVARECRIHNGEDAGVLLSDDGRAKLIDCEINGNSDAGVSVYAGGIAIMQNCNIKRNGKVGVRVKENGAANVENCDITENRIATWETEYGALVESRGNRQ
ncbi:MAG: pectinesterase family protein [Pyrinomonadaceae bacterium]